ncbi:hypothetical protein AB0L56_24970 [Streptomyces sp. NPDC052079]|uniref:hypothetical protein n=1 Tax=Streptomyces sp. NPDC052079 TaxID=3155526 RepID=UPI00341C443C
MEKWRNDAQPEKLEDATAADELPEGEDDGDSAETDSIEERWARIGVFPTVNDKPPHGRRPDADHTVSLRTDSVRATLPHKDRPPATRDEQASAPQDADRSAPLRDRRTPAPREADRTTALRREEPMDTPRDAAGTGSPRGERTSGASAARPGRADAPRVAATAFPDEDASSPREARDADRLAPLRDRRTPAPREADRTTALRREEPVDTPRDAAGTGSPRGERTSGASAARPGRADAPRDAATASPDEDASSPREARDADRSAPLRDRRTPAPREADRTTALRREEPMDTPRDAAGTGSPRGERTSGASAARPGRADAPRDAATAFPDEDAPSPRDARDAETPRGERAPGQRNVDRTAPSCGEQADGPSTSRGDRADAGRVTPPRDADRPAALLHKEAADAPHGERAAGARDAGPVAKSPDGEQTTVLRSPRAGAKSPWSASSADADAAVGATVRDPWQEEPSGEAVAATHDPHEVTVQLDAVQFKDGVLRRAPARPNAAQEGSDGPVFVDESGRRSRRYRRIGMSIGLLCAGYAVVIVATLLSGTSDAPWLPVPGQQQEQKPAGKVETTPKPGETAATPGAGTSLLPGGPPSPGAPTLPKPGASMAGPGATAAPDRPGATADPKPSQTGKTQKPGTGPGDGPTTQAPAETPTTAPADPPPPVDDPTPGPTAPTDGGAGGTGADTNAAAPARPVAAEGPDAEPEPSAPPAAPSPEYVL